MKRENEITKPYDLQKKLRTEKKKYIKRISIIQSKRKKFSNYKKHTCHCVLEKKKEKNHIKLWMDRWMDG